MTRFRSGLAAVITINVGLLSALHAQAAWQNNAPFGATLQGDLYSPTTPGSSPAVLVAIHYCTGNKSVVHSWFESAANQYGFYIVAPDAGKQCFDSSLSRDGDKAAIVKMVDYVLSNTKADKTRVFAAGLSSGGCMTNTLLAAYPEVFAGGAAMPGFPAGAWPAGDTTCTKCGSNPPSTTGQQWADMVTKVYAFSGTRPCVQQWVGGGDEYNFDGWLPAVASQFQTLSNLSAGTSGTGAPSGWTRTEYKDGAGNVRLQTNLGPTSQKHDLSSANLFGQVVSFLGLDKPTGSCGITTSSGTGGTSSTGGASAGVGGTSAKASGGTSAIGNGGSKATGGATLGAGGSQATGGSKATGGAPIGNGGTQATGGSKATGGAPSGNGGTQATGGSKASGGVGTSTGGAPQGNGGSSTTATTSSQVQSTGGSTAVSTTASASGGNASDAGSDVAGNTTVSISGCGCRVAGTSNGSASLWSLGLLGLAFAACRKQLRKQR